MTEKTVRGPLAVGATPLMVTADVEPLVTANVAELLDLLCSDEFFQDFMEIADPSENGGEPANRMQFETLQARLVDRMSTRVALTGPQAMRVAGRMAELGRPLAALSARTAAVVQRSKGRAA
ncbi:hypothetical protein [Streptomyces shenzhenensis]|uniref:hypothetical protein n=1 Tax=Streptomyces shenzhenensis TaxID=943815 RepID=UPI0036CECC4F